MAVGKKLRFEVFKRDSFTCQYCGRKAPDVVLECDHLQPVSKDGSDDILNLVTSCWDCNSGKSNRLLTDSAVIEKKRAQLEDLQERREQLEMMMDWQRGLVELKRETVDHVARLWSELTPGYHLNEHGIGTLTELLQKVPVESVCAAMRSATEKYLRWEAGEIVHESVDEAWNAARKFAPIIRDDQTTPWLKDAFYIRGIIRNRLSYYDPHVSITLLKAAFYAGYEAEYLKQIALDASSWTEWRKWMESL